MVALVVVEAEAAEEVMALEVMEETVEKAVMEEVEAEDLP